MEIDVTSLHNRRAVNRWERMSVGDMFERLTWSYPDKPAIVGWTGAYGDERYRRVTYQEADRVANQLANGLLARGLSQGDRVLLFCENSVEAYLTKIGIAKAGLVAVPLNPALAPDVVAYLIELAEPAATVVDSELWTRAEEPFTAAGLRVAVTIPVGGPAVHGSVTFSEFVATQPATEPDVPVHGDDIWELLFTSGTTAMPKGAMLSHAYSYTAGYNFALTLTRGLPVECDLKLASFLPMIYHVGDQVFTFPAFLSGGTLLLGRRPDAATVAQAIHDERVTALWAGSPQFLDALARELDRRRDDLDPTSLTSIVYGWAALSPATKEMLEELCGEHLMVVEIFGQTESIACHRFWPNKWPQTYAATAPQTNYVGVPSPLLASDVVDSAGGSLRDRPGVPGEAVYRSPATMAGYYKNEAATLEAFRDGWFHSGDSCAYDSDGLRIMVDRFKDIVKSGGENVSSMRVESVLVGHPGVARAAVVGLPHPRWGEGVTAVVVKEPGQEPTEEQLLSYCRERLAGFESPKAVVFMEDLPVTVGGKVLKYRLREQLRDLYA